MTKKPDSSLTICASQHEACRWKTCPYGELVMSEGFSERGRAQLSLLAVLNSHSQSRPR